MQVGFIGVGSMGAAIIPNIVAAGHQVTAWNRTASAVSALGDVAVAATPNDVFQNEVVFNMLSDDRAVRSVVLDSGALASAQSGCIHVMMATISPALAEELTLAHQRAHVGYLAAPVFGVPAAAAKAQLNIMVAGDALAIAKVQPLFDVIGQKTWRLGDQPMRANVAKIAGNMMITLAIEAMGEATALTESYGLKAADFLEVVTNTIMASPSYKRYGGFIATDTYEPGFKLTLGLKDVNLAIDAAKARGATMASANIVRENMIQAVELGLGSKDWSILAKMARRRAGLDDTVA
jgi:3-hydroxyisobutyrate dehydrogenase-like beta-hydroxyacid dehydrogenase